MKTIIVQTTCANKDEAKAISKILIQKRLAACVHMSKIDSFYLWNNEFCEDSEMLLSIKTKKELFKKVESKIKELHSYDVPEIISINIKNVSKDYRKFIGESCK
ncbi:divalent-cation tolerance protein CutA [Halarcobacter ebronensis]|uniref:Divalent-cation tolerance protein CutA n=1 Tax=Halarcobacter ebronensis TaxID=1462615 RepID=A0A4Q1AQK0_9BACT|nr:divalent-cation tolerance protein CutA [Halarcobacter ebronensis]QKF80842.1 putative CutA divalent ion tolerance protein [Halarcobacter ebronensis]RXK08632.1 divalent-cation tolerance protein CutA [Halarcobacter ebronensis]